MTCIHIHACAIYVYTWHAIKMSTHTLIHILNLHASFSYVACKNLCWNMCHNNNFHVKFFNWVKSLVEKIWLDSNIPLILLYLGIRSTIEMSNRSEKLIKILSNCPDETVSHDFKEESIKMTITLESYTIPKMKNVKFLRTILSLFFIYIKVHNTSSSHKYSTIMYNNL